MNPADWNLLLKLPKTGSRQLGCHSSFTTFPFIGGSQLDRKRVIITAMNYVHINDINYNIYGLTNQKDVKRNLHHDPFFILSLHDYK